MKLVWRTNQQFWLSHNAVLHSWCSFSFFFFFICKSLSERIWHPVKKKKKKTLTCCVQHILGDPEAVSWAGRKGATKVFKHKRKSLWVPTLRGFSACAWKLSSRLFSRPNWPLLGPIIALGLRGWHNLQPFSDQTSKSHTRFQTWFLGRNYVIIIRLAAQTQKLFKSISNSQISLSFLLIWNWNNKNVHTLQ